MLPDPRRQIVRVVHPDAGLQRRQRHFCTRVIPYVSGIDWNGFAIALNYVLLAASLATFVFVLVH